MDTIDLYQDEHEEWRWTRRAANGEVIGASTEGYTRRTDATDNIVRTQIGPYELREDGVRTAMTVTGGHDVPIKPPAQSAPTPVETPATEDEPTQKMDPPLAMESAAPES